MGSGLMAHTLHEQRDLNSPKELFEDAAKLKTDPEMIALAKPLIQRQSGQYDPADLEDRYETRLRAMLDAKLKGEGLREEEVAPADRGKIIDLMAALKKSLGQTVQQPAPKKGAPTKKAGGSSKPSGPQAAKGGSRKRA